MASAVVRKFRHFYLWVAYGYPREKCCTAPLIVTGRWGDGSGRRAWCCRACRASNVRPLAGNDVGERVATVVTAVVAAAVATIVIYGGGWYGVLIVALAAIGIVLAAWGVVKMAPHLR